MDSPPDAWSGVWIAEDIELIAQGVKNGSWIDTSLGVVGAGLDALAIVSDPIGALLQYGVAWIIEHVKPLSEALDWLAGDPGQIAGHAQTWRNVAASLRDDAADLDRAVRWDVTDWTGTAGNAYRTWAAQQSQAIGGLAKAADTMAVLAEGAGALIAAVRILVRDAIATCVSRLVVYAAEVVGSLGVATPLVVEQVTTLVASWAAKIARWLKGLLSSLRELGSLTRRLGELIEELKKIINRLRGGGRSAESLAGEADRRLYFHHSEADPLARWGSARETHLQEWDNAIREAEDAGVEVIFRQGGLAYGPSPSPGHPGVLILDPDASYGALLHEMQHMRDDRAAGWAGMRGWFEDPHVRYANEVRAYEQEIRYAESIGDHESAAKLTDLIREEYRKIFGETP
nr:hypothetical protein [Planosporangium mesophilum]